ncbi:MAG: hypothetical protein HC786_26270 [Richelia sp. CSU_2_1]|nr:hypothetical protein [Richelia sp. CSU_2_1]
MEIADVASGKAPNLESARAARDFDMKLRGLDPDADLTAGDRARLALSQMDAKFNEVAGVPGNAIASFTRSPQSAGFLSQIDSELAAAESGMGRLRNRTVSAADAASNALSSVGISLSAFAPAVAAPLFAIGDLLAGFTGLSVAIPQLAALFPSATAAAGGFLAAVSGGSLTASGAVAAFAGAFSFSMAAVGTAASAAWAAISGPLLPVFLLLGAIAAAFVAFKFNFLGIGDVVSGVFEGVKAVFGEVWGTLSGAIGEIGGTIGRVADVILEPLSPLFQLFGINTEGGAAAGLQAAGVAAAIRVISLPIKAIGAVLSGTIWTVAQVVKGLIWAGGILARVVLAPAYAIASVFTTIVRAVQFLGSAISTVLYTPFLLLQKAIDWIWARLSQLPAFLGQAIGQIPLIGGLLQKVGGTLFESGGQAQTPVQQFASGGLVTGPGSGTADRIPALLSNGEFVVSAGAVRSNLGLLQSLNEGRGIDVVPLPAPAKIPVPRLGDRESQSGDAAPSQMPPVEININLNGDVVLSGGNSAADAQEFLTKIEPYLQQAVWAMFRNWVDFNR